MPGMTSMCSPSFCNIRMNKFELNRISLFQFIELEHVELGQNQQNYELKMMRTPPKKYIEKILSDRSFFQHAIYDVSDLYVLDAKYPVLFRCASYLIYKLSRHRYRY